MTAMFAVRASGLVIAITGTCMFVGIECSELMGGLSAMRMASACAVNRAFYARDKDKQEKD